MLSKEKRLRNAKDIARVYAKGKYAGAGIMSIKVLQTHLPESRAVVVVGKKVSKKATVRNRIRRRIVPILASQWQTVRPGYDIVLTVHEDMDAITPSKLQSELQHLLKKANLTNV